MVEQSDRAPLLDWEEIPPQPDPARTSPSEPVAPPQESVPQPDLRTAEGPGRTAAAPKGLNGAASPARLPERCGPGLDHVPNPSVLPEHTLPCSSARQRWEDGDQVVAVFVVTFDTRSGNMVEWCMPQDVNLDGVEFKSMASGSHRVSSDFIYFRKGSYFGLACFANVHVESARERGARMKSVGVLCPCYTLLYRYMHFLENQVRLQLQSPGHYSPLEAFYQDKKALLAPSAWGTPAWGLASVNRCIQPDMKITHPAGCMSQFSLFFGEQIMVLWKLALLRKRLLFFSPPPVGVVCYRVYCCCCLANVSIPGMGGAAPELRPFFYVNIADIAALETELSYVACTTEKIFEEKKDLYDVYIDNQNVRTHRASLQPLLRLNAADRDKYRKLSEQRQMLLYSQEVNGDVTSNEEELFILFFMQLNDRIFQTLAEVSGGGEPMLTQDQVQAMGLDPQGDRRFLEQLLEVYGIDATLVSDHPCCT